MLECAKHNVKHPFPVSCIFILIWSQNLDKKMVFGKPILTFGVILTVGQ